MAVQVRSRRLVNPSSKKKKRKLSPKQIAIFGTARQKAALRASRSRKRNAGIYSVRKFKKAAGKIPGTKTNRLKGYKGPNKKLWGTKGRLKAHRARKANVGEIVSISLAGLRNPGKRKGVKMAKRLKNTKAAKAARRRYRMGAKKNPGVTKRRRRTTHTHRNAPRRTSRRRNSAVVIRRINRGRRRNAGMGSMLSGVVGKSVGVIAGALGARYLPQLVLGGNNTGVIGYVGNLVSAFALGYVGKKAVSPDFGTSVMAGGIASTILRVLNDTTSFGTYINTALSGAGRGGDIGLGIIQNSSFSIPQVAVPGSMTSFVTPAQTRSYVQGQISAQMAQTNQMKQAGSKAGMGTVFGRPKRAVM